MKKTILVTIIVSLVVIIAVCKLFQLDGTSSKISFDFTASDVVRIEIFTGSVPARAKKKIVTNENDIENILAELKTLTIEREATDDDITAGGIGMRFLFHLSDDNSFLMICNSNLIVSIDGFYKIKGDSLDTDNFWKSLNYEEMDVTKSELPTI